MFSHLPRMPSTHAPHLCLRMCLCAWAGQYDHEKRPQLSSILKTRPQGRTEYLVSRQGLSSLLASQLTPATEAALHLLYSSTDLQIIIPNGCCDRFQYAEGAQEQYGQHGPVPAGRQLGRKVSFTGDTQFRDSTEKAGIQAQGGRMAGWWSVLKAGSLTVDHACAAQSVHEEGLCLHMHQELRALGSTLPVQASSAVAAPPGQVVPGGMALPPGPAPRCKPPRSRQCGPVRRPVPQRVGLPLGTPAFLLDCSGMGPRECGTSRARACWLGTQRSTQAPGKRSHMHLTFISPSMAHEHNGMSLSRVRIRATNNAHASPAGFTAPHAHVLQLQVQPTWPGGGGGGDSPAQPGSPRCRPPATQRQRGAHCGRGRAHGQCLSPQGAKAGEAWGAPTGTCKCASSSCRRSGRWHEGPVGSALTCPGFCTWSGARAWC